MTKKKERKTRPETYDKTLSLHPLTVEEALKIALETKPPGKKASKQRKPGGD